MLHWVHAEQLWYRIVIVRGGGPIRGISVLRPASRPIGEERNREFEKGTEVKTEVRAQDRIVKSTPGGC